jgi:hypothetical protein
MITPKAASGPAAPPGQAGLSESAHRIASEQRGGSLVDQGRRAREIASRIQQLEIPIGDCWRGLLSLDWDEPSMLLEADDHARQRYCPSPPT